MVSLEKFYENVKILIPNESLKDRLQSLLEDVIRRLPDEPQFQTKGLIGFGQRDFMIYYWNKVDPLRMGPDFRPQKRDGHCQFFSNETKDEIDTYFISIITDSLDAKSDDYIMGLITHELSHMSCQWNLLQKERPNLEKLNSKIRQVRIDQIWGTFIEAESKQYYENERKVNAEAIRLGFEKEIDALES